MTATFDHTSAGLLRLASTGRVADFAARSPLGSTWLGRREEPTVLVAGADRVRGRWIVHLLSELSERLPLSIHAQGRSLRPLWLNQPAYRDVVYHRGDLADRETARRTAACRPDLVLSAEGEDGAEWSFETLYRANVLAPVELAQAVAEAAPLARFVHLVDARPAPGDGESPADGPLEAGTPQARCGAEAERTLLELRRTAPLEPLSLRLAFTVGPLEAGTIARLANLVRLGLLPALPGEPGRHVSILSLADAAWAAVLLGLVDLPPSASTFQVAAAPIDLDGLVLFLDRTTSPECLFGVKNDLVRLFDLSMFGELRIPARVLEGLQRLGEGVNGLLNSVRLAPQRPSFDREILRFLTGSRPISTARFQEATGWLPADPLPAVAEMIRYHRDLDWRDVVAGPEDSPSREAVRSIAQCRWAVQELRRYRPETGEGAARRVTLPRLDLDIDLMSLSILIDKSRRIALGRLGEAGLGEMFTFRLPGFFDGFIRTVREAVRFEYHMLLGGPRPPTLHDLRELVQSIRLGHRGQITDHLTATLLDHGLGFVAAEAAARRDALALVPDLRYGFLVETDLGLVGVVLDKSERRLGVSFPREDLGPLAGIGDRARRLLEFKRALRLDSAIAAPLSTLLADLASGSFLQKLLEGIGRDYLVTSSPKYFRLLSREVFGAAANRFFYLDKEGRLELGLVVGQGRLRLEEKKTLEAYGSLLGAGVPPERLAAVLAEASGGSVRVRFEPIDRTRRLLAAVLSPGPITRFLGALRRPAPGGSRRRRRDRAAGDEPPPRREERGA